MSRARPLVSVVLPVYNGARYLKEAIDSVLAQSFCDFELIIIDDGSEDESAAIVRAYADDRIRFFQQPNKGLAATLNRGISLAAGEFIARQDQDDVCFPERFRRQVEYLKDHPEVGMVGTFAEILAERQKTGRQLAHPLDDAVLKFGLLFDNHFVHSSMMIRRAVFDEVGGYSEDRQRQPPEDYELWSRVIRRFKVANLPEVLMAYRELSTSMSRTGVGPFVSNLIKIGAENIAWASGYRADAPEVVALARLTHGAMDGIPNVGYFRLRAVIDAAMQRIVKDQGQPSGQLDAARRTRLRRLMYQYANYKSGGLIAAARKLLRRGGAR